MALKTNWLPNTNELTFPLRTGKVYAEVKLTAFELSFHLPGLVTNSDVLAP